MTLTTFCFYPIQQTSNHDTYNVPFLSNSTDFQSWHLQWSVTKQFKSSNHDTYNVLFLSNSTDFQSWHLQWSVTKQFKSSNHDTYNVLFLSNSTDFQSWHLQCSVSIQFNRLPIMTLTMFCFYPIQQTSKHWTPKQHTQPKAGKCPSSPSHFSLFTQDRHCNTHRNGNCPDNTTHLAVHLDRDLCRHRHQLFCFIQCARNHHLRRYCKTNQTNHAVKMTIKTIN